MPDLRAHAREAAHRAGLDPDLFERQIQQESGFDPNAYNPGSGATGVAQLVPRFHPGVDPHDPLASLEYAARWMASLRQQYGSYQKALAAYNWGPGNVAGWDGRREGLPAESQRYLDVILGPGWPEPGVTGLPPTGAFRVADGPARLRAEPGTFAAVVQELPVGTALVDVGDGLTDADGHRWRRVAVGGPVGYIADELIAMAGVVEPLAPPTRRCTFDPTTPTQLQVQDWTCSIRSTMWMLKSLGIAVTAAEAQAAMSPTYVTREVGLLDASGAGIVAVLRDVWGVTAFNRAPVSFDEVVGWAGRCPVAIGGRNWGHWTAVRGTTVDEAGQTVLTLANPGGTGPRYGQQTLNRQQFADLGWFSAVVIPVE